AALVWKGTVFCALPPPPTETITVAFPVGRQIPFGTVNVTLVIVAAVTAAVKPPTVTLLPAAVALKPVPVIVALAPGVSGFGVIPAIDAVVATVSVAKPLTPSDAAVITDVPTETPVANPVCALIVATDGV